MSHCAEKNCHNPVTVIITARSRDLYRAAAACPRHHAKTRAWAARAGPVEETPANSQHEPSTLF